MSKISATIVADSLSPQGDRLISVLCTFPRIILSEVNTHRMLSKNTSSSRAIPFNKMVESVKNDPFIPIAWQKEHKGMQGSEYIIDKYEIDACIEEWLEARDSAVKHAVNLNKDNNGINPITPVTKQLCNRLLEPFMWTTMLITGSKEGWENFFNLRCPSYTFHTDESEKDFVFKSKKDVITKFGENEWVEDGFDKPLKNLTELDWLKVNYGQAEIHIMALAECIWDSYNESTPRQLKPGEWHIPFGDKIGNFVNIPLYQEVSNKEIEDNVILNKVKISVAMAARTSYTVVGEEKVIDYEALIGLHDRLLAQDPPHSSPMEHACQAVTDEEYNNSFKGQEKGWFRNYKGFKSYRQIIEKSK